MKRVVSRLLGWHIWGLVVTLLVLNLVIWLVVQTLASHRPDLRPTIQGQIEAGFLIAETLELPRTAFYPPGVPLLFALLRWAGIAEVNPFVFHAVLLNIAVIGLYATLGLLTRDKVLVAVTLLSVIVNPYLVWTALVGRDNSPELAFSALSILSLVALLRTGERRRARSLILVCCGVILFFCLSIVRVTHFDHGSLAGILRSGIPFEAAAGSSCAGRVYGLGLSVRGVQSHAGGKADLGNKWRGEHVDRQPSGVFTWAPQVRH